MTGLLKKLFKSIEVLMALLLTGMFFLVFMNVMLRYLFNTGITWSEEMARYLFFWLTFIGAIGAMHDNAHLGLDTVLRRLSPQTQKIVYLVGQVLILVIMGMLAKGSYDLTLLNVNAKASATGLPLTFIYGTGILTSICIIIIALSNMYKAIFVPGAMKLLIQLSESEEIVPAVETERKDRED